ncbi:MAG: XisI protein [Trichocoleus desertorum ATA4-8-CV12]|jgi:hypothetical protein|nr:XisI protein [Trichocoleus desertorum ATA4-8-CV12]
MEKLEQYRNYIQKALLEHAQKGSSTNREDGVETQIIFDTEHDHYQLMYVGWHNKRRVYGAVLHLDIKDGKIWVQWNGTEEDIASSLVELGVPKQDIVLGFQAPYKRQFTEFAIG